MKTSATPRVAVLLFATLLAALFTALPAGGSGQDGTPAPGAEVRGRVEAGTGASVEHARVTVVATGETVFTDSRGRFRLAVCASPCLLRVEHPRFEAATVELDGTTDGTTDGDPRITLVAKQEVFERIDVTAAGGGDALAPASVASTQIRTEDRALAPTTLTELVEGVAGVAENGQAGLFQVFSIRGVSRQRVLTLVSGMRIVGERRAGVSTSFIDPTLMGAVDVLRGPASTYYGSGALGGVVQIFPRVFEHPAVEIGYRSFGDENYQRFGWGGTDRAGGDWSLALARRDAKNGEAADGTELNTHFTQVSAAITRRWEAGGRRYELLALPSYGHDVGKSNTDFPQRVTDYPSERHLLLRFGVDGDGGGERGPWSLQAYVHPNDLETLALRRGRSRTRVDNRAFDFGAGWQRQWARAGSGRSGGLAGRFGLDLFGRRGVDSTEVEDDLADGTRTVLRTLDGGTEDEVAAFGTLRWSRGETTVSAGGRLTWQGQKNGDQPRRDDTAWTAFVGAVRPLGNGFELAANLGTGLRFPSLSERFFTGTTGRGGVIGNPDLDAESSTTLDLGLRWYGERTFFSLQTYRQRIEDYIERVEVDDDLLSFVNLSAGTIEGVEVEGFYQLADPWTLSWNGHLIDGDAAAGGALADVPADRAQLGLRYLRGPWESRVELQYRARKDDPGSGEQPIPAAELVSAALSYRLGSGLVLSLRGRNLLDREYFNSADDKTPLAPGRSVGISLSWTGS